MVRRIKLFILDKFCHIFRALLIIIKLKESEFCWSDGRANELVYFGFVLWIEEKISLIIVVELILELTLKLDHVF